MDEPGRTSVTPPPWWEQTGRARVSALLAAAGSGDSAAWSELVDLVTPFLWGLVRNSGVEAAARESIVQSVYEHLVHNLDRIQDEDALRTWVLKNATRELQGLRSSAAPADSATPTTYGHYEVDRTTSRLSTIEQHLLRLTLRPGATYADIATSLQIPVGSIGPTRDRMFKKMWRISTSDPSVQRTDPPGGPSTTREKLERALLVHNRSRSVASPERKSGWLHTVARAFGLIPPPWSRPTTDDELVVAACRDVTGTTRETLREVAAVAAERDAFRAGDR
ncbi:hypothetical protein AB0C38_47640 [Amycolatopsis sp. NPDC048633]|uniref:hypothetical protein n=1 Tax=Amycolatopsis sp. NPDC048633 TaxID=3157095 RepID=UPI0033C29F6D